jgi:hypothetical protein
MLTDEQIIKAFEVYYEEDNDMLLTKEATKAILDLIKRQQAEKEALIAGQETLQKMCAEAYKYFAERLKDKSIYLEDDERYVGYAVRTKDIENLLYELTEGSNDERRMD